MKPSSSAKDQIIRDRKLNKLESSLNHHFRKKGLDDHDRKDFTQEVFCRVIAAGNDIDNTPLGYFLLTANNLVINHWRKKQRNPIACSHDNDEPIDGTGLTKSYLNPEYLHQELIILNTIDKMIEAMPNQQRKTFLDYRFNNHSIKEIASARNVTPSSVEKLLTKANQQVRSYLQQAV